MQIRGSAGPRLSQEWRQGPETQKHCKNHIKWGVRQARAFQIIITLVPVRGFSYTVIYLHITEILKLRALGPEASTDGGTGAFGTHRALLEVLCASL